MGVSDPLAGAWPEQPYTVIERTPIIREKPYLYLDEAGRSFVMVPDLDLKGTRGITWRGDSGAKNGNGDPD